MASIIALQGTEYEEIFDIIIEEYTEYCTNWFTKREDPLNLKKIQICNIYSFESQLDYKFDEYIHEFKRGLAILYIRIRARIETQLNISSKVTFIGRVKTEDSLFSKIHRKFHEQDGHFPVNSCINDLLGFRIIDPFFNENISEIKYILEKYKEKGFKVRNLDRINKGYIAYHIYFRLDNTTFPIEVQIWDKTNEKSNLELHEIYKKGYIKDVINEYTKL